MSSQTNYKKIQNRFSKQHKKDQRIKIGFQISNGVFVQLLIHFNVMFHRTNVL